MKIFAWFIIIFWFTRPFVFGLFNIDFASNNIDKYYGYFFLIMVPFAVVVLIDSFVKNSKQSILKKILLFFLFMLSIVLVLMANFLSNFCLEGFSQPMYIHKTKNIQIREGVNDCGALDSSPSYQLVITRQITPFLLNYKEIKEEEIDLNEWEKVKTD